MPRPAIKRRRQNSFTLKSSGSRKQARVPPVPDPAQVRQHLEAQVSKKPVGKTVADSDDSDDLVTGRAMGRGRKRIEIYASGGVARGDKPGGYPSRAQRMRNMREDTEEVLRSRSRSASRASAIASASASVSRAGSVGTGSGKTTPALDDKASPNREQDPTKRAEGSVGGTSDGKKRKSQAAGEVVNGVSHALPAETSVLGRIKPRKRQDSILQLIQNDRNDDSTLLSREEAEFLPDAVSTPMPGGRSPVPAGLSLKRKRGSDGQSTSKSRFPVQQRSSAVRSSPEIAQPSRSQKRKMSGTRPREEDSVMALPESSDSEESTGENEQARRPTTVNARRQQPVAPSTEQLQNLMPSKRHKPVRQRQPKDSFDIPEDSQRNSDAASEEENEHSAFLPARTRKTQKRAPAKSKAAQSSKKPTVNGVKTRTKLKDQSKSTNNITSFTPSPVRVRTPLPLSSSAKRTTRDTQAKSPSKQGPTITTSVMRDKTSNATNTPLASRTVAGKGGKGKKQYGGSRLRGTGKENRSIALSDELSGDEDTIEVNVDVDSPRKAVRMSRSGYADAPEIKAWKKKWADIDDFEMEFEDVSVSTRSSSPMAR